MRSRSAEALRKLNITVKQAIVTVFILAWLLIFLSKLSIIYFLTLANNSTILQ